MMSQSDRTWLVRDLLRMCPWLDGYELHNRHSPSEPRQVREADAIVEFGCPFAKFDFFVNMILAEIDGDFARNEDLTCTIPLATLARMFSTPWPTGLKAPLNTASLRSATQLAATTLNTLKPFCLDPSPAAFQQLYSQYLRNCRESTAQVSRSDVEPN